MKKKKVAKFLLTTTIITAASYVVLDKIADKKRSEQKEDIDLKTDPYKDAGKPVSNHKKNFYEREGKRAIDKFISFAGLVVLAPVFGFISLAIVLDDPGPVLFTQKRVGENKTYFKLHKFRSMKMCTPHDVPTHMLENPEQYITRVGKILRKYSLDELPQIWDIFVGNISTVGPRPALWNQTDLIEQRDLYCANDVKPGLTGWAQINGRDELEIDVKAKFDGQYTQKLQKNSVSGFFMDMKCFFKTILSVLHHDGVVEGGTGELNAQKEVYDIDLSTTKKVLITGANSYIGTSFENYVKQNYANNIEINTIDMIDGSWKNQSFSGYDAIFHVAGIAHADVENVSEEVKQKYYDVNTTLAIETAKKAKEEGVKQFVFMSSIIIYGDSSSFTKKRVITKDTQPNPSNFYGDSKWQADKGVRELADDSFHVVVVRPPMIYGKGSKGNYPTLAKIAQKTPVFPYVKNERSMLHIDNLCEFISCIILCGKGGIFFPQNKEYVNTCKMVDEIAQIKNKTLIPSSLLNPFVFVASKVPGKISTLTNKAFGNLVYEKEMSVYPGMDYQKVDFKESIERTEGK